KTHNGDREKTRWRRRCDSNPHLHRASLPSCPPSNKCAAFASSATPSRPDRRLVDHHAGGGKVALRRLDHGLGYFLRAALHEAESHHRRLVTESGGLAFRVSALPGLPCRGRCFSSLRHCFLPAKRVLQQQQHSTYARI